MHVSHKVGCYVHLAEGGDGQSRVFDVLYVPMRRRVGDDIQQLLRLVCMVRGQEHVCGENHTVTAADVHWFHKDGDIS